MELALFANLFLTVKISIYTKIFFVIKNENITGLGICQNVFKFFFHFNL